MSGEPDDEDLERLLDADQLPGSSADPLAALLHAAATAEPDRALRGEEAAAAAFRAAFAPQPSKCVPRRRPLRRIRTRRGVTAALLTVIALAIAALALPRLAERDIHHGPSLTATTAPRKSPPASPHASDTTARPLDDNATLTSAASSSPSASAPEPAAPDLDSAETNEAKTTHSEAHHAHAAKK